MKLLLVEDDIVISSSIAYYLTSEGFEVDCVDNSADALIKLTTKEYKMVLLDVTLKDANGFELFGKIRNISSVAVIFLTALDEEINVVRGLEMGADDYITKPFRARELLSRIKAVLRRCSGANEDVIIGNIRINMSQAKVYKQEQPLFLTALEYKILLMLIENKGRVLSRDQILAHIWDVSADYVSDNTLTVYIKRLREKIEDDVNQPKIIVTVRGLGYKLGE